MSAMLLLWLTLLSVTTAQLVGPGAMAPYGGGGGGGRRHGGYVRVQEPAKGFFIAGSALKGMNGLYGKVETVPSAIKHSLQLAYRHDQTNWFMALTVASKEKDSEWLIIDEELRDRFHHKGRTIIPGSGTRWSHLHRAKPEDNGNTQQQPPPPRDQEEVDGQLIGGGDDIAELPWQMIAILDEGMLRKLRRYSSHHHDHIKRALAGGDLPSTGFNTETKPPLELLHPRGMSEADDVCLNDGDLKTSMSLFGASIDRLGGTSKESKWQRSILLLHRACCYRRIGRNYSMALNDIDRALSMYPSYTDALFEKGVTLYDHGGQASEALQTFLQLLKLDRNYPSLNIWIVRTVAQERRIKDEIDKIISSTILSDGSNAECVAWRQTSHCNSIGQREENYDKPCHEQLDGRQVSGYCECHVPSTVGNDIHPSMKKSLKIKNIYFNFIQKLKFAGNSSCDGHLFTCTDQCREQWVKTMSNAESNENVFNSEGQTTLQGKRFDIYNTCVV